eukprot:1161035-Pelagomonas_calceolata.AAC.7
MPRLEVEDNSGACSSSSSSLQTTGYGLPMQEDKLVLGLVRVRIVVCKIIDCIYGQNINNMSLSGENEAALGGSSCHGSAQGILWLSEVG